MDWSALAEKERRDRSKLQTMVELVYSRVCRQESILRYFGEDDPERCGICDLCADHASSGRREGTEEEVIILRKALSGVARMSQRRPAGWQGRFGKGRIVQALLGSRTRAVLDARLDELSTYGLLRELGISYVNALFREMQSAGLLTQTRHTGTDGKDYQLITLTALGEQVMRGQVQCQLSWPEQTGEFAHPSTGGTRRAPANGDLIAGRLDEASIDPALLNALKKKREELAHAQGDVPRYVIFPDETLRAFARLRPKDDAAGRRIRGVGEMKAEKYLPAFLEVIRDYAAGLTPKV